MPTRKHMSYQANKALPYWFHRWVAFDKTAKLEPLYTFDHVQADAARSSSVVEYQRKH